MQRDIYFQIKKGCRQTSATFSLFCYCKPTLMEANIIQPLQLQSLLMMFQH